MLKNWLKNRLKQRPAETLVEVVVAVFVVVTGSAVATSLIVTSMLANSFSKDNLVALNLAVEGLEAVRNIRDTNWMKFGFDKTNCWNLEPLLGPGSCAPNPVDYPQIQAGTYSVDLNPNNYSFDLTSVAAALDLSVSLATNNDYRLDYVDLSTVLGTQDILITANTISGLGLTSSGTGKFYRMIDISYAPDPDPAIGEVMHVTSTVQWVQHGLHQVQLETSISNYQKVPL